MLTNLDVNLKNTLNKNFKNKYINAPTSKTKKQTKKSVGRSGAKVGRWGGSWQTIFPSPPPPDCCLEQETLPFWLVIFCFCCKDERNASDLFLSSSHVS